MSILELTGLCAGYGAVRAVDGIDVQVNEGEFVVLLGPNGAGKSTTMRVISGLLPPTAGKISFLGSDITKKAGWRRVGLGLGHVPEGRQIFGEHTVHENLVLGAFSHRGKSTVSADLEEMTTSSPGWPSAAPRPPAPCPVVRRRCSPWLAR